MLLNVTVIVPRPGTSLSEARGLGITKVRTDERLATTSPGRRVGGQLRRRIESDSATGRALDFNNSTSPLEYSMDHPVVERDLSCKFCKEGINHVQ